MIGNPIYQLIQLQILNGQNMVHAALKTETTKTEQYYRGMLDAYEAINQYVILLHMFEDTISKEVENNG